MHNLHNLHILHNLHNLHNLSGRRGSLDRRSCECKDLDLGKSVTYLRDWLKARGTGEARKETGGMRCEAGCYTESHRPWRGVHSLQAAY